MKRVIKLFNKSENETSPGVVSIVYRDDGEVAELARIISGASGLEIVRGVQIAEEGAWEFEVQDLPVPPDPEENPEAYADQEIPAEVKAAEDAQAEKEAQDGLQQTDQAKDQEEVKGE